MGVDEMLHKVYYEESNFFGRDGLFHLLKRRYPETHPTQKEIEAWLANQELQQLHAGTRSGGGTDRFRPTFPWNHISIDLIDFSQNAAPNAPKYGLVCVDNFSRYMIVRVMRNKTAKTTARHLETVLDEIRGFTGGKDIKRIITDDGGEFKGPVNQLLDERGIAIQRALGGNPQQNGLVERANGKVKNILKKIMDVRGGSWSTHLQTAAAAYNRQFNRGTQFTPNDAVKMTQVDDFQEVKDNVKEAYTREDNRKDVGITRPEGKRFEVGDRVRVKLNKSTLAKSSDDNWSSGIYTVETVIRKMGTRAEKYRLKKQARVSPDYIYTRNDLLKVDVAALEKIPFMGKAKDTGPVTRQRAKRTEEVQPYRTRSRGALEEQKEPAIEPTNKPANMPAGRTRPRRALFGKK